jgi:hypothetical protein
MLIPDIIRIGSYDYKTNIVDKQIILNGQQCKGMIDYEFHTIEIDNSVQDIQGQEQTFLHELIHGIVYSRSLELGEDLEKIVDEISIGLHQVIKDNPKIFMNKPLPCKKEDNNGTI